MIARLRWPLLLATLAGFLAALWAIGRAGLTQVLASAEQVGLSGFLGLCLLSAATFFLLGGSWLAGARGLSVRWLAAFAWGRATREAAADLLPFSQLGGVVLGVRTVVGVGAPPTPVYAATIVDMSTEMAAQLVFTLFAVWALTGAGERTDLLLWSGLAAATALALSFFVLQRPALRFAGMLARRMLPQAGELAVAIEAELAAVYRCWPRIGVSLLLNLLAWIATGTWSWVALRLMGVDVTVWHAAALESAIFALRSAAFMVPGALGVQEAGYALLAPLVGVDPAAALALSLVKRARDVSLGVPILLLWQASEIGGARKPG